MRAVERLAVAVVGLTLVFGRAFAQSYEVIHVFSGTDDGGPSRGLRVDTASFRV